jgi:hypothetical protein
LSEATRALCCAEVSWVQSCVVIRLDAATVCLQWAVGGMFFCWVTTRHRVVGLGYGWLLRGTYAVVAGIAVAAGVAVDAPKLVVASALAVVVTCVAGLASSVRRRRVGVSGGRSEHDRRSERVATMTGIARHADGPVSSDARHHIGAGPTVVRAMEFDPRWDLIPVAVGVAGLIVAAFDAGGHAWVAVARTLAGAAFLGVITDAMLLGHWYLVQPGLSRRYLLDHVRLVGAVWPFEVATLLLPTGMVSVLKGTVDDGWGGILGWTWIACAVTTIALVVVTRAALRERQYSAVMAATGLLYLAILTGFGTDLVARAVLAP